MKLLSRSSRSSAEVRMEPTASGLLYTVLMDGEQDLVDVDVVTAYRKIAVAFLADSAKIPHKFVVEFGLHAVAHLSRQLETQSPTPFLSYKVTANGEVS